MYICKILSCVSYIHICIHIYVCVCIKVLVDPVNYTIEFTYFFDLFFLFLFFLFLFFLALLDLELLG